MLACDDGDLEAINIFSEVIRNVCHPDKQQCGGYRAGHAGGSGQCDKRRVHRDCVIVVAAPLWAQSSIVFTWGHSPSNAKIWPACSKSVTTMAGYTLKEVTIAAPVVISAAITGSALTYTLTPLPAVGTHIYDLFINARGSRGEGVQSAPATVAVSVSVPSMTFSPPTGFEAKASLSSVVFTWTANGNVTILVCKKEVTVAALPTPLVT